MNKRSKKLGAFIALSLLCLVVAPDCSNTDSLGSGGDHDAGVASLGVQTGGQNGGAAGASGGAGANGWSPSLGGNLAAGGSSTSHCPASPPTEGSACVNDTEERYCHYQDCATYGMATAWCAGADGWKVDFSPCSAFECIHEWGGSRATCAAGEICLSNWGQDAKCAPNTCAPGLLSSWRCASGADPKEGFCTFSFFPGRIGLSCCPYAGSGC
jgi:hypothetical protein